MDGDVRLGFVGLGRMGEPMAGRLVDAGTPLTVWTRSPAKLDLLAARGATPAMSAADLFERCDVVILMLTDGPATDEVLGRSADGFAVPVAGKTLVNMGTISPDYAGGLRDQVLACGGRYVEAPVSGSRVPAQRGELVAMLAGDADAVGAVEPLLGPMTAATFRCGDVPRATEMKLAVNVYLIGMITALAESFHFAQQRGLDPATFRAIVDAGQMSSPISRIKVAKLVEGDHAPQAAISDVLYNNRLILEAAGDDFPMPLLDVCAQLLAEAEAHGHGTEDMIAVIEAIRAKRE
ncbi:3-hydroxyisobutyrate dehydrogenase [Marmoricola sp. URHA0025 HA25]